MFNSNHVARLWWTSQGKQLQQDANGRQRLAVALHGRLGQAPRVGQRDAQSSRVSVELLEQKAPGGGGARAKQVASHGLQGAVRGWQREWRAKRQGRRRRRRHSSPKSSEPAAIAAQPEAPFSALAEAALAAGAKSQVAARTLAHAPPGGSEEPELWQHLLRQVVLRLLAEGQQSPSAGQRDDALALQIANYAAGTHLEGLAQGASAHELERRRRRITARKTAFPAVAQASHSPAAAAAAAAHPVVQTPEGVQGVEGARGQTTQGETTSVVEGARGSARSRLDTIGKTKTLDFERPLKLTTKGTVLKKKDIK